MSAAETPTRAELADALAARIMADIADASLSAVASAVRELRSLDPERYEPDEPAEAPETVARMAAAHLIAHGTPAGRTAAEAFLLDSLPAEVKP